MHQRTQQEIDLAYRAKICEHVDYDIFYDTEKAERRMRLRWQLENEDIHRLAKEFYRNYT